MKKDSTAAFASKLYIILNLRISFRCFSINLIKHATDDPEICAAKQRQHLRGEMKQYSNPRL